MLSHLSFLPSLGAALTPASLLLDQCLIAVLILGVIAGCIVTGEPEDPSEF